MEPTGVFQFLPMFQLRQRAAALVQRAGMLGNPQDCAGHAAWLPYWQTLGSYKVRQGRDSARGILARSM